MMEKRHYSSQTPHIWTLITVITISNHQIHRLDTRPSEIILRLKSLKGKCILTVDDTPWIRERYTKENVFYIMENNVFYSSADADNRRHVTELIITNFNPNEGKKHIDSRQGTLDF